MAAPMKVRHWGPADLQAVARLAGITTDEAAGALHAGVAEAERRGLSLDSVTIVLTPTKGD